MLSRFRQSFSQLVGASFLALLCVLAIGVLQIPQLNKLSSKAKIASAEELEKEVEAENIRLNLLQKFPDFGFDNLLADWVFLGFAQYFGDDEVRKVTGYTLSPEYFEIIVNRDPRFREAYLFLSASSSLYAALPERSVALMEKGLKSLTPQVPPKSYFIWRYKGMDELLFLGNAQAARQSFEKAVEWAKVYSDPESKSVAEISRQTSEFLVRNPNSRKAQVSGWILVLTNPVIDDRTRKIAISRIEALGGKVIITPEGGVQVQLPEQD
ncbi:MULTISPECIES: hypothetical protein [unclassified Coleofasciculus]|uniref:hypothetical protein n=1 Tax=Cyanophyceae TaxID=3028117 RepID=UPI00168A330A|nr:MULTISPECIES: hypothetical protein [unclassified Coleofasciculus]MBD1880337.1 hypothetical protein [Coleofasciculus sp. FACHB-T130]MBD1896188.1 hypothetical protein [Coleofasciculus sp. FACHB-129]MBD2086681.1 hypothetical protein [Coleofasciculus sp. FACHB-542]MBD2541161.1 hypothetical protein [Coleofasciculus sp. FACHB-SPT36]